MAIPRGIDSEKSPYLYVLRFCNEYGSGISFSGSSSGRLKAVKALKANGHLRGSATSPYLVYGITAKGRALLRAIEARVAAKAAESFHKDRMDHEAR